MGLFETAMRAGIKKGQLITVMADGKVHQFGTPIEGRDPVRLRFTDKAAPRSIALNPSLGAGEAYMDGRMLLEQGDILDLLDLVTSNGRWEDRSDRKNLEWRYRGINRLIDWVRTNNQERRSKRNVAHHYDLSAALYDLFLDKDRQYSCAYFTDRGNSLEQAQLDKKAHIVAKLRIEPHHKVLDIGCGWGGMALYIHEKTGADVLGITLSEEQLKIARERAEAAGVAHKVRFELIDYRHLEGQFDRIVSVGMFEHVGPAHYRTFLAKSRSLLVEEGVMLLHTIGRLGQRRPTDSWTTKYIFPGGYIPTLSQIAEAAELARMVTTDVETLRFHYAYTLEHWLRRTQAHKAEIEAMYDARFYRMWEFYLAGSLTGFTNGQMVNYQLQYVRQRSALPLTRDYLFSAEQALREKVAE